MSRIQAACQGIRRVPSGGIGECRTSKLNSRGTCRQLYTKGLSALASVTEKDPYLMAREEDMRQGLAGLDAHLQEHSEKELQSIKDKEADELDVLFQPKKKW